MRTLRERRRAPKIALRPSPGEAAGPPMGKRKWGLVVFGLIASAFVGYLLWTTLFTLPARKPKEPERPFVRPQMRMAPPKSSQPLTPFVPNNTVAPPPSPPGPAKPPLPPPLPYGG